MKGIFITLCFIFLSGCALHQSQRIPPESAHHGSVLSPDADVLPQAVLPDPESVYRLTSQQQVEFLDYYHNPSNVSVSKHQRVFDFLINKTSDFTYNGKTLTASEAYSQRTGNCLTLAILTRALADLVDIPYRFQLVTSAPIYKKANDVILVSQHVRTKLYDPDYQAPQNSITITRPHIIVDYFATRGSYNGRIVSENEFSAMFYRNKAANALKNAQPGLALEYIEQAIALEPHNSQNIAAAALVLSRNGRNKKAEEFYQYALDNNLINTTLLYNYSLYLTKNGQPESAKEIMSKVESVNEDDPYSWIFLGDVNIKKHNYRLAKKHYIKAVENAPYLDDAYFGLAKSEYGLNNFGAARKALEKALELAWYDDEIGLYQAKLEALSNHY